MPGSGKRERDRARPRLPYWRLLRGAFHSHRRALLLSKYRFRLNGSCGTWGGIPYFIVGSTFDIGNLCDVIEADVYPSSRKRSNERCCTAAGWRSGTSLLA